jgi:hypothetical protein
MRDSLDEYMNDMRMSLSRSPELPSFCNFTTYDSVVDVEDCRLKFSDDLYDVIDQLIHKYENIMK